ncbi:hypothetical protein LTR36_005525 [Oleoguttula mirabilis]|uniref:Bifunctional lycopene cyclase/phytoene synthase n=1 Tax=Oleoguttula mirabilis TaxID=1507867 RepID=A0AAV9JDX2_9PEZI|nr:hypothetical protein LTR36_005525 [Oleoguttula mirabilis]
MGYDYALVHLTYTLPPAALLTLLYAPLCTKLDLYKIAFLIAIAVTSTIPWDSYLIRNNIWSYPPSVVLGPKIFDIPIEEVFFFVVQTFNTTLLYLLLSKPALHSTYLLREKKGTREGQKWKYIKLMGQLAFALTFKKGIDYVRAEGKHTYLGLIFVWAAPFLWVLWSLAYQFLVRLPFTSTLVPIVIPTLYLWVVDTLALKRGTWVIEAGTKTGIALWPGLEIEEAVFFLLTNCLIVFGLVAFDNAIAVLTTFPSHFPRIPALPSPALLVRALLVPASTYDDDRILALQQSVQRLKAKSRSFYLASSTFQGRLRIDLTILYSFCRVADDLIDNAKDAAEAKQWVAKLKTFVDLSYAGDVTKPDGSVVRGDDKNQGQATIFAVQNFPDDAMLTLLLLPTQKLDREPLNELLRGFEMDLAFTPSNASGPIKTEADLDTYGARVAGTVALLCIQLVLFHYPGTSEAKAKRLMAAGHDMGIALQYTNIARDLAVDAQESKRCYVPPAWLKKEKLTPESFITGLKSGTPDEFFRKKLTSVRGRLLERAFALYEMSRGAIEELPREARAPMRVAVESYMQIARELRRPGFRVVGKAGRASVPGWKRIWVGWRALLGPVKR